PILKLLPPQRLSEGYFGTGKKYRGSYCVERAWWFFVPSVRSSLTPFIDFTVGAVLSPFCVFSRAKSVSALSPSSFFAGQSQKCSP
ncbi:unnamed protein product, partial [Linum tenue]